MDMEPNENGNIELHFIDEGKKFVVEITERDARSFSHMFQLFKN